jgi:DNA helicase-2/ATP-dependent DNA helicase PcrA
MSYHQNFQHLSGLNDQQRDAVLCQSDLVFVSAGPGTGKTHMLTSKLLDYIVSSCYPQKIVALSYTNTAARQIGERFQKKAAQCGISDNYSFYNGTIHSFCFKMMKSFGDSFDYTILDEEELIELASDIIAQSPQDIPQSAVLRCLRSDPKEVNTPLYESVSQVKESLKVISIQDILSLFLHMLESSPEFCDWMRTQVTVMAVDEAQDLTELNYLILDRLIEIIPHLKVFLVGDPRQNIFEFNGGSYKNLDGFLSRHTRHEVKSLTITYRCGQAIADYVNGFHFTDCDNLQLQSRCDEAGHIAIKSALDEVEEAKKVLESIKKAGNISSCAVLCNNLKYLDHLIYQLQKERIPYKVFGGRKTLKRHIRFLNHILRIVDSENAYSIRKIAEYAGINITVDGKRKKSKFYESQLGEIITSIREKAAYMPFGDIAALIVSEIMMDPTDDDTITQDYLDFQSWAYDYDSISDYLAAFATDKERFMQFYEADYPECPIPTDNGFLTLSTIHSAKGLEWDHVFIMGLEEGQFPNPYFCKDKSPDEVEEFFNGEWKKMYVASTRARESLVLSYATIITRKGFSFRKAPSRFINTQS